MSNTYENLKGLKRISPEGAETIDDNVYDVAEFVEKISLQDQERKTEIAHPATLEEQTSSQNDEAISPTSAIIAPLPSDVATNEQCLIENEGEKTIIFTSAAVASSQSKHHLQNNDSSPYECNNRQSSNKTEHQILISSSSWIDLQGESTTEQSSNTNILKSEEINRNCDSPAFGSLPIVSCKLGGSLPSDVCKLEVGSISIGGRPHASEWAVSADPGITLDSLEPVKPPRLKKIARMQQQQQQQLQNIHYQHQQQQQHQNDLLRHVMHREQFKMSNRSVPHHHHHQRNILQQQQQQQQQQQRNTYSPRPDISAPILLATTLNPNDADGHR